MKQGAYFYSKGLKFNSDGAVPVFQMNHEIYNTGYMVDTMVGGMLIYSTYKLGRQFYTLAFGAGLAGFSFTSTAVWSVLIFAQLNYLA
jgi:hypothetical protein